MASKDLVPVASYAALQTSPDQLMATIKANIGGAKLSEFDLDRIKIPAGGGKAWDVPTLEGSEAMTQLQGVIVFWKDTRAYWKESYEKQGGGAPPDCSSRDALLAQGDPGVPVADDAQGFHICETCPNAQFGSDPRDGSNAQACKLVRQLFLLTPNDLLPLVVSLPPTSVQEATRYFLRLSRAGVPYYGVVTNIGLEQTSSGGGIKYSKAEFSLATRLEGEQAEQMASFAQLMAPIFEAASIQSQEDIGGGA